MKKKGIYWLASYPKSGNTWFRVFLGNLHDGKKALSINQINTGGIASSREWLDDIIGFDTADLYTEEVKRLRPAVYQWTANVQAEDISYHKIHDACCRIDTGEWLVSAPATIGAIYIIRNPLDVVVSLANHRVCTVDESIVELNNPLSRAHPHPLKFLSPQVEHRLSTWSGHVESWVDNPCIDTLVVRYEDMKQNPFDTFSKAANYLGLTRNHDEISKAIMFSDFNLLKSQELKHGFLERPQYSKCFFRKGIVGDWQNTLTPEQIKRVIDEHYEMMQRFGYLDSSGNPTLT